MKTTYRKIIIAATGSLLLPLSSQAAVISQFQFTSGSSASSDSEAITTTSGTSFGSGISGGKAGVFNDRLEIDAVATTPVGPTGQNLDAQLGHALTNNQYFGFTVTIPATHTVDLTLLTFTYSTVDAFRFGMGAFSDKTGFALADRLDGLYVNTGTSSFNRSIDLTGMTSLQDLTNTTVEFRFYTGDNSTASTREHRFDNIELTGDITVIPEPASALLGGLGLLALLRRRR